MPAACHLSWGPDEPLAFLGMPLPSLGPGPGAQPARRDTYRRLGMSAGSAADPLCDLGQIAFLLWTSVSHLWNGHIELEAL